MPGDKIPGDCLETYKLDLWLMDAYEFLDADFCFVSDEPDTSGGEGEAPVRIGSFTRR